MRREVATGAEVAASSIFVTDLDGTLLDEASYGFAAALPALERLARGGSRLVLASSKTRAEMEPLARELGLGSPLIVENGGAVLLPDGDGGYEAIALGVDRPALVRALAEISAESGATVRGFAGMARAEVARATGLSEAAAALAMEREYDEPFLLADSAFAPALAAAAARRGLRISRGGRFHHLTGACDKGAALRALLGRLPGESSRPPTVGLGDAGNDLPLLLAVDRPIVVPRPGGRPDPELAAALPAAELAPEPGPAGWNTAVLAVLDGARLPPVSSGKGE